MTLIGRSGQITRDTLLDTGSDDVVFPLRDALLVGIPLAQTIQRHARGLGATQPAPLFFAKVTLQLSDGRDVCRWSATIGFTPAGMRLPLFGVAGGLEHFLTTIDFVRREFTLLPQPSLPATTDAVP